MGYNTTVLILNDSLGAIQRNPELFVDGIREHMHQGGDIPVAGHCNAATVMRADHADVFRLYCTQGNSIIELSKWSRDTMDMVNDDRHPFRRDIILSAIEQARRSLTELEREIGP